MQQATLVLVKKDNEVLLGMKKRGFGKDKWNGFGGKPEGGESIEDTAKRELLEESGVKALNLNKVGELTFIFPTQSDWNQVVHVFLVNEWEGNPEETEEMKPQWFSRDNIPYSKMWNDDAHWLPLVLEGKHVEARFTFKEDKETIHEKNIDDSVSFR